MPPARKTDEQRRESVLKAARKVFESKGLEGASMRMIASAARCTTGSIYPYFKGKEEIYAELLSRSLEAYRERLMADVQKAGTPAERFAAVMFGHFDHYESRPGDMALALYLFNGLKPQSLTKELDARLNHQLDSILDIFRQSVRELAGCTDDESESEVGLHYSVLFGLLILYHTRRTRVLRVDTRRVLEAHVRDTVERLAQHAPKPAGGRRRAA
ncbi:MAG TPA: TetR/AcrR family transcriptional regulator [Burkholderiaceae bacterium]|nr:TetR/AcrR family transcriptional regulator [Burkholderiaceae bacterium]